MKIEIVYFGKPRENLNISQETVDVPDESLTLSGLLTWLGLNENDEIAITARYHGCSEFWIDDPRLRPKDSHLNPQHCS